MSANTLGAQLSDANPDIVLSSVFRALGKMVAAGELDRVELLSGYRLHRPEPTVALICRRCGSYAETAGAPRDELERLALGQGFDPIRFVMELQGLCRACSVNDGDLPTSEPDGADGGGDLPA
jgi:Fe2+ or Zn2+ uptake regulation protein